MDLTQGDMVIADSSSATGGKDGTMHNQPEALQLASHSQQIFRELPTTLDGATPFEREFPYMEHTYWVLKDDRPPAPESDHSKPDNNHNNSNNDSESTHKKDSKSKKAKQIDHLVAVVGSQQEHMVTEAGN